MQEFLERELHSARANAPLAVLMIDLDHFKRYNDNYGHAAGDKASPRSGRSSALGARRRRACRYGGEEFTVILPECSLSQAAGRGGTTSAPDSQNTAPNTTASLRML